MDLFLTNKQVQFNVDLNEIKKMTPEEAYFFSKRLNDYIERINNGI